MATNSRYDFMKEGAVIDEITESAWPDPLTLNYHDFEISTLPSEDILSDSKIMFLWMEAERIYGKACWDDMVLTLNGIPHKNFLNAGDKLYFPSENDIIKSFTKER